MHRLFVALRPPPPIRRALTLVKTGVAGARWQDDDQLHLTLRFVGTVERWQAEDVAAALAAIAAPRPTIRLTGVGRFDALRGGAALWAGVAPREPLAALHRKVDQACGRAGLPPEGRAFLPHVTLARLSRGGRSTPRWIAGWVIMPGWRATPSRPGISCCTRASWPATAPATKRSRAGRWTETWRDR